MKALIILILALFTINCGEEGKEKQWDDCYIQPYADENTLFYACSFVELQNEKICLKGVWNQFSNRCSEPVCDKRDKKCFQGCSFYLEHPFIEIICSNIFY